MRWLRPEYQVPRFGGEAKAGGEPAELAMPVGAAAAVPAEKPAWPATVIAQIAVLKALAEQEGPLSAEQAAARFAGAKREIVSRHLETLAIMGEVQQMEGGRYAAVAVAA